MSNAWQVKHDEMSAGLTEEFGERVKHLPMLKKPNERATPDPDRPEQETRAILSWLSTAGRLSAPMDQFISKGHDTSRAPPAAHHASRNPQLSVDLRDFASPIKSEDWLVMLEGEHAGVSFEVISVLPDGARRAFIELRQRGRYPVV